VRVDMKGRTKCPKCGYGFVVDAPDDSEKYEATCPECRHVFMVRCTPSSSNASADVECGWEEHGEPRKTVLSSLRPKTNKPIIASVLLTIVFFLGVFTAVSIKMASQVTFLGLNFLFNILLVNTENLVLITLIVVFSGFALAAAAAAFKRQYFGLSVAGAVLGIFSFGFIIGIALSICALALIMLSRDEFENGTKGKVF